MKPKILSVRLTGDLKEAFQAYSRQHYQGNDSDAVRSILSWFLFQNKDPQTRALIAAYNNVLPRVVQQCGKIGHNTVKSLISEIGRIISE